MKYPAKKAEYEALVESLNAEYVDAAEEVRMDLIRKTPLIFE